MSLSTPLCPSAGEALVLSHRDDLDLWTLSRAAAAGPRRCPMCERSMAVVDVPYDADEIEEGSAGDADDDGSVLLDVCADCQVIWFDTGEYDRFPADRANEAPSDAENARLAEIRAAFGADIEADLHQRNSDITDRAYSIIARHPKALGVLTRASSRVLPDFAP